MIRALRSSTTTTAAVASRRLRSSTSSATKATFATQSGNDASRPTALAKLYLEDGTTMTGLSFGSHESVEGEVREESEHSETRLSRETTDFPYRKQNDFTT
jgi:hypothetical protein